MSKKKYIRLGGSQNPVGYCAYHKATLSVNQLKGKECLQKNCDRLIKYDHDYWKQIEKAAQLKKQRKDQRKQQIKMDNERELRNEIMRRVRYCYNAPKKYKAQLDYCSQCKYGTECMSKIVDLIYEYFERF